jgi:hypothetical protein
MTTVNFTVPPGISDGSPATADDTSFAFDVLEGLFQSGVHNDNFSKDAVIRGQSFRKSALSDVFSRKTSSEHWSVLPGTGDKSFDVPGGALRFRLRAPADVLVFFSATVHRINRRINKSPDGNFQGGHGNFSWAFNAVWEGSDSDPGSEYMQAKSLLRGRLGGHNSKFDVSRGVFMPWQVRPVDEGVPVDLRKTRMVSPSFPNDVGRLQAGWHNVRHTVNWDDMEGLGEGLNDEDSSPTMVIGNTELVVVANYGRKEDTLAFEAPVPPPEVWTEVPKNPLSGTKIIFEKINRG